MELLFKEEVYAIVGAAMEVYNTLGSGFLEAVYQEALEIELRSRNVPFLSQSPIRIHYKGKELEKYYVSDLFCYDSIIVELKAIKTLTSIDEAQLVNYLKATKITLGLLINFGNEKELQWKRMILTH